MVSKLKFITNDSKVHLEEGGLCYRRVRHCLLKVGTALKTLQ